MNINNVRLQGKLPPESPQGLTRQQLERSWKSSDRPHWSQTLQRWRARAVAALTQGQEPKVSSVMTEQGLQWRVYDPLGDRTHRFTTETEVRTWLEQRHNIH